MERVFHANKETALNPGPFDVVFHLSRGFALRAEGIAALPAFAGRISPWYAWSRPRAGVQHSAEREV
jgi:hypothetical protein